MDFFLFLVLFFFFLLWGYGFSFAHYYLSNNSQIFFHSLQINLDFLTIQAKRWKSSWADWSPEGDFKVTKTLKKHNFSIKIIRTKWRTESHAQPTVVQAQISSPPFMIFNPYVLFPFFLCLKRVFFSCWWFPPPRRISDIYRRNKTINSWSSHSAFISFGLQETKQLRQSDFRSHKM